MVELHKARKIERLDTAKTLIIRLSSQGKKKQATAKDKLEFYTDEYVSRTEHYEKKVNPPARKSYKRLVRKFFVQGTATVGTKYSETYKSKNH